MHYYQSLKPGAQNFHRNPRGTNGVSSANFIKRTFYFSVSPRFMNFVSKSPVQVRNGVRNANCAQGVKGSYESGILFNLTSIATNDVFSDLMRPARVED